ncbi:sugar transferase [Tsukamurella sp. 8F]|uniref:sugar transferase n=1 Tax=unclassified Tsukamurella TaxID=2633480 RepID=UPI0023BA2B3D|nr:MULTISPECIES: sugar transferase [unclassified Tsukamurella]MDF0530670.1 sugar transferase [Tsukamurella sp. 8J]MDF0587871.1 sugar transferase [Tsukamurella sp. 8F]
MTIDRKPVARAPRRREGSRDRTLPLGRVVATDTVVGVVAVSAGVVVAIGHDHAHTPSSIVLGFVALLLWLVQLAWSKALAVPLLRLGTEEFRHVIAVTFVVFGGAAVLYCFYDQPALGRLVQVSGPLALVGVLASRIGWRRWLRRQEARRVPTLVVGGYYSARATCGALLRAPETGTCVVGVCVPAGDAGEHTVVEAEGREIPIVGTDREILQALDATGARAVALTATDDLGPGDLRRLIWELEEREVELVVTPGVVDIAGHRIVFETVGDMPMLHIAQPQHARADSAAKRAFDIAFSAAALIGASPVLLVAAIAVKLTSPGPVFYNAERIGEDGEPFTMHKFRSMYVDADKRVEALEEASDGNGVLFKMKDDPRVTRAGRILRRLSIDELPQFINVLKGDMSVVGPRPALAREVSQYPPVMRRRLLVKPGVTGAWQVSGRSDLSWNESIRLDIGYVENWSLGRDIAIVARTVRAVTGSDGAY